MPEPRTLSPLRGTCSLQCRPSCPVLVSANFLRPTRLSLGRELSYLCPSVFCDPRFSSLPLWGPVAEWACLLPRLSWPSLQRTKSPACVPQVIPTDLVYVLVSFCSSPESFVLESECCILGAPSLASSNTCRLLSQSLVDVPDGPCVLSLPAGKATLT